MVDGVDVDIEFGFLGAVVGDRVEQPKVQTKTLQFVALGKQNTIEWVGEFQNLQFQLWAKFAQTR